MKFLSHVLIFLVGAGVGVWWGVSHPAAAQDVTARERAAAVQAKIDVLTELQKHPSTSSDTVQKMLDAEKQKQQTAQSQTGN